MHASSFSTTKGTSAAGIKVAKPARIQAVDKETGIVSALEYKSFEVEGNIGTSVADTQAEEKETPDTLRDEGKRCAWRLVRNTHGTFFSGLTEVVLTMVGLKSGSVGEEIS